MKPSESESYHADDVSFRQAVLRLVNQIPAGRVATYGQLALLSGRPRAARLVGAVLRGLSADEAEHVPWQRVVNAQGGISTYKVGTGELQRALLGAEGVRFGTDGRCDLDTYRFSFGMTLTGASGGVSGS